MTRHRKTPLVSKMKIFFFFWKGRKTGLEKKGINWVEVMKQPKTKKPREMKKNPENFMMNFGRPVKKLFCRKSPTNLKN